MAKADTDLISVDDAISRILDVIAPIDSEQVSISQSLGRVLSTDIISRTTQPPLDVSAMDGYAVRTKDISSVPTTLLKIGESAAGSGFTGSVGDYEAVRIFTGAPVPSGADAIVIQENTVAKGNKITVNVTSKSGQYIRSKGLDFKEGETLLSAGTRMNSRHVALVSAMNVPWIKVKRKPRIAILPTGNELVMPGEQINAGHLISSNSLGLSAFIDAAGGEGINLGIAKDNPTSLRNLLTNLNSADMLVTIGGASVGDYDLIKEVLKKEGLNIKFSKVAMRPGKPLIFGQIKGKPMLGLPGNPVSASVTALLFLKPVINLMLGRPYLKEPKEAAILQRDLKGNDQRQDYLRAKLSRKKNGELCVTPFEKQDSSMLAVFSKADCLIVRKPFARSLKKGNWVSIIRLDSAD